ncbi:MAG: hypothetical protein H7Z74_14635, partial [Anaerolineae bacterium]|nr:hypothetical protein [Gemmatimonadaceae bacterium]
MKYRLICVALGALVVASCSDTEEVTRPTPALLENGLSASMGHVYAMTNAAAGNAVLVYSRASNGMLTFVSALPTGGLGSGQFEDSSNGLLLASRQKDSSPTNFTGADQFLIATNAASNSISVFRLRDNDGPLLVDVVASNGEHPVSVTVSGGILYVLNNGDAAFAPPPNCAAGPGVPNITGFKLSRRGELTPIPNSTRALSGDRNSGCAQVSFTPRGDQLVVTERTASGPGRIDTYRLLRDGTLSAPVVNTPTGIGPFGFNFTMRGELLTTENFGGLTAPGQGHAAPYFIRRNGTLEAAGPTVGNGGTDTCWLVLSSGDKYAYVTNFFSSSISSYIVESDGSFTLLEALADETIGVGAADEATSQNGQYLYAR